ncbi:MAG: hypothetical protein BRC58_05365 [Cyanobacteria bacterium QS_8_64_29]|jgi:hypothetical protein|nr:MAG: hypothetical protein BRC58_05365 [Cyanobacteria bacterium QS_8_64_29]
MNQTPERGGGNLPPEDRPQGLTPADLDHVARLNQQAELLRQFNDACGEALQGVLETCEWTIRPGAKGPLLEITCPTYGAWRQILERSTQIASLLRAIAGPNAEVNLNQPRHQFGYQPSPQALQLRQQASRYRQE